MTFGHENNRFYVVKKGLQVCKKATGSDPNSIFLRVIIYYKCICMYIYTVYIYSHHVVTNFHPVCLSGESAKTLVQLACLLSTKVPNTVLQNWHLRCVKPRRLDNMDQSLSSKKIWGIDRTNQSYLKQWPCLFIKGLFVWHKGLQNMSNIVVCKNLTDIYNISYVT